jgi:hypothetical protein
VRGIGNAAANTGCYGQRQSDAQQAAWPTNAFI